MEENAKREEILARLERQEKLIQDIYTSVEKTRKMIFWSGVATLVTFVIPFILLLIMLPRALSLFSGGTIHPSLLQQQQVDTHSTESLSELLNALNAVQ